MKLLLLVCLMSFFCTTSYSQTKKNLANGLSFPQASKNKNLIYKIINAPNNTFGYDIFSGKQKMIHQPSIPGMPGNEGFKTKPDAENVAKLVITKIKKGEMPPTVSKEELINLKAIK